MADLVALSIRHYRLELHQRITRYKQMLLVVLLLALPGLPAFKAVVLSPLEFIYAAGGTLASAFVNVAYVALLGFWALLQRGALVSSAAGALMASLPIGPWRSMTRDIALLSLVSLPFTLLLLVASITASGQASAGERGVVFAAISALGLAAQIAVTRRRYAVLLLVVAAAFGNGLMPHGTGSAATLVLSGLLVTLLRSVPVPVEDFSVTGSKGRVVSERGGVRVTPMGLNWRALYHGRHGAYRFSLALFVALALVLGLLLHGAPSSPVRVVTMAAVFGAVAASVFGLGFGTAFKQQDAFMHVLICFAPWAVAAGDAHDGSGRSTRYRSHIATHFVSRARGGHAGPSADRIHGRTLRGSVFALSPLATLHGRGRARRLGVHRGSGIAARVAVESLMAPPLRLENLTVAYGRTVVFERLTHEFGNGCHAIVGPNGAGKSTLLGAVSGSVPYRGRALVSGQDLARNFVAARRALAYVPDAATFYPFLTGEEFIDFVLRAHGLQDAKRSSRYGPLVDQLNVAHYLAAPFAEASLGTRKKFFLLTAFLLSRSLLVLDEPFNGLDRAAAQAVVDLVWQAAATNCVLLTCHQPAFLDAIGGVASWHIDRAPHHVLSPRPAHHAVA